MGILRCVIVVVTPNDLVKKKAEKAFNFIYMIMFDILMIKDPYFCLKISIK